MSHRLYGRGLARPLLDIASYARSGPNGGRGLTHPEMAFIARTVRRTPEVMVKVLSTSAKGVGGVRRHFDYLSRKGELELETDDGRYITAGQIQNLGTDDWDLDLEETRPQCHLAARKKSASPKLVHKIVFSMPAGTSPEKVLQAVRLFCREEFALKHRYALVLHTDEPHPHVHVVVKAMGEEGERLNIRKANLRLWRQEFARHLRAQGLAANATERAVRGAEGLRKTDGIYRAWKRGRSTHLTNLIQAVADELDRRAFRTEPGKARVVATRAAVVEGWNSVGERLAEAGQIGLAAEVRTFTSRLGAGKTQRERIAEGLLGLMEQRSKARPSPAQDPRISEIGGR